MLQDVSSYGTNSMLHSFIGGVLGVVLAILRLALARLNRAVVIPVWWLRSATLSKEMSIACCPGNLLFFLIVDLRLFNE